LPAKSSRAFCVIIAHFYIVVSENRVGFAHVDTPEHPYLYFFYCITVGWMLGTQVAPLMEIVSAVNKPQEYEEVLPDE
jgi:hypothetical protein